MPSGMPALPGSHFFLIEQPDKFMAELTGWIAARS